MIHMLPLVVALLAAGCQGDINDELSDDTGSQEDLPVFDPDDPGVYMFLTLGGIEMGLAAAEVPFKSGGVTAALDFMAVD